MSTYEVVEGDCLDVMRGMADGSVQTCVTSPPYFNLRDYGIAGQIGLEGTPEAYVARLVEVFREVRRVLRDDGTVWLNLGDSFGAGKQLQMIPHRVAIALQDDGWVLRADVVWHKPNPMPESVRDRPTRAHEYIFLLAKRQDYYYDAAAIAEPAQEPHNSGPYTQSDGYRAAHGDVHRGLTNRTQGPTRNKRDVWTVTTKPCREAHFATFPPDLIEPCILAGAPVGGMVLDPFAGAGTTGLVAVRHGRAFTGIELNPEYAAMARRRIAEAAAQPRLAGVA